LSKQEVGDGVAVAEVEAQREGAPLACPSTTSCRGERRRAGHEDVLFALSFLLNKVSSTFKIRPGYDCWTVLLTKCLERRTRASHAMNPTFLDCKTAREAQLYHARLYYDLINSGQAHAYIYPFASLGALVVIAYLLIDHRNSRILERCRYPVFGFLVAFQGWCIFTCRAKNPAAAFGIGLASAWGVLWTATLMILSDCQTDFQRIERADDASQDRPQSLDLDGGVSNGVPNGSYGNDELRHRKSEVPERTRSNKGPASRIGRFFWQSYPESPLVERVDWIADVFCSFRGVGWTFQTAGVPPPPRFVAAELGGESATPQTEKPIYTSKSGIKRYSDRSILLKHLARDLAIGCIALDALCCVVHRDAYFWTGQMDSPAPTYLPAMVQNSFFLTKSYRLLTSLTAIYFALWTIFKLGPIFFCGVLGPKLIGVRGEPWMNPSNAFGDFALVLEKGLAGWWGGWWHQTFRIAFEAPANRVLEASGIDMNSLSGKAISLFIAFFLSGCLHAAGSYTQLGATRPLSGPMLFFVLQAVGILGQQVGVALLRQAGVVQKSHKVIRQLSNFIVVHIWMWYTARLLVDDFARGGIWLFEPLPFSPLRALGLGGPDDMIFCWGDLVGWHTGKHWWDSGLAF
jgi:hypothetical protein